MSYRAVGAFVLAFSLWTGREADAAMGPGSTTGAFLKLPSGARAIAMGEAYSAAGDGIQALTWNPAGLANVKQRSFSFMHSEWVEDIRYESATYAQPVTNFVTLAAGVDFMFSGDIQGSEFAGTDAERARGILEGPESIGFTTAGLSFSASNLVLTAGAAVDVSGMRWITIPNVQAGINIRGLLQNVAKQAANGAVVDVGARWSPAGLPSLTVAAVGQNLGPSIKSTATPITLRLGACYRLLNRNLLLASDYYQPVDNKGQISAGAEYWYRNMIAVRMGWGVFLNSGEGGALDLNQLESGGLERLTLGAGFKYQIVQVDYAFRSEGFLGAAHRMSLTFKF